MYQNDGTARITPSHFVERAAAQADDWTADIDKVLVAYLLGEGADLLSPARKMAADISQECDRVRTGQLKASFEGEIVNES